MKMPSPSEAEKWITPDVFVYQGNKYEVDIHSNVRELVKCQIHGVEYLKDTECLNCMAEQDAANDAKRDNAGSNR